MMAIVDARGPRRLDRGGAVPAGATRSTATSSSRTRSCASRRKLEDSDRGKKLIVQRGRAVRRRRRSPKPPGRIIVRTDGGALVNGRHAKLLKASCSTSRAATSSSCTSWDEEQGKTIVCTMPERVNTDANGLHAELMELFGAEAISEDVGGASCRANRRGGTRSRACSDPVALYHSTVIECREHARPMPRAPADHATEGIEQTSCVQLPPRISRRAARPRPPSAKPSHAPWPRCSRRGATGWSRRRSSRTSTRSRLPPARWRAPRFGSSTWTAGCSRCGPT